MCLEGKHVDWNMMSFTVKKAGEVNQPVFCRSAFYRKSLQVQDKKSNDIFTIPVASGFWKKHFPRFVHLVTQRFFSVFILRS